MQESERGQRQVTRDYNLAAQAAEPSKAYEALAHTPPPQKQVLQHESLIIALTGLCYQMLKGLKLRMMVSIMRVSAVLQDDPDIIERLTGGLSGGIRQAVEGVKQVVEMGKQAISSLSHEKKQASESRALSHRNCTLNDSSENITSRERSRLLYPQSACSSGSENCLIAALSYPLLASYIHSRK